MSERTCGGCTACCKTHAIREEGFNKPEGEWCTHCEIGKGCGIYQARPTSCQVFKCAWLEGFGTDEHRPDLTQVVPDVRNTREVGWAIHLFAVSEDALETELVQQLTFHTLQVHTPVMHVPLEGNPTLYLPAGVEPRADLPPLNERPIQIVKGFKPAK
jgi:hypothetical protein